MKRKIAAFLMLLLYTVFVFAGCSKPEKPKKDELIVIGMSQVGAESDWRQADTASMKSVFTEANGYRLLFEDARQEQENQFVAIRRFIQQKVDYIVVMPITEDGWDAVLNEAKAAGIPVILVDRMVNVKDDNLITAHVGSDFYAEGKKATDWMKEKYSNAEQVNIIHIQGTKGSTPQLGRTSALDDAVKANSKWKVIARMDGDFTEAKTYEVMREYLSNRDNLPVIDVVYCENDNSAYGAIKALESFGYTCGKDGVSVISFDATYNALVYCQKGKIALTVECNPLLGPLVESVIRTIEEGKVPEKNRYVEETAFKPEDITEELLASRKY
ncbi:MAG: ABC transporter substrate-binding protein [Saccharofermentans sp.]|nr:ABC transporter substrate-binding protein [Saccharofermentans sp.]